MKSLKRVVATTAAVGIGAAALISAGVELSTVHWAVQPQVVAGRHVPGAMLASRASDRSVATGSNVMFAGAPAGRIASAGPGAAGGASGRYAPATVSPTASPQDAALQDAGDTDDRPALFVQAPARQAVAKLIQDTPPGQSSPSSVLVYADGSGRPSGSASASAPALAPPLVPGPQPASPQTADDGFVAPPVALVTMVSEAALTEPGASSRPIIVPISFGRPAAPEDDAAPVSLNWRHHGFTHARHSYFLPPPSQAQASVDALAQICRTPGFLR